MFVRCLRGVCEALARCVVKNNIISFYSIIFNFLPQVIFCPNLTEGLDTAYTNVKSKRLTGPTKVPVFTIIIQVTPNTLLINAVLLTSG